MFTKEDFGRASDQIKAKITVPILWARFYGASPQKWQSCRCPWRHDKHPSFGVSEDGKKWIDRATSDSGDVFDFYIKATGCDRRSSFRDLLAMAGGADGAGNINSSAILVVPEEQTKEQYHPVLRIPSAEELATISQLRSISVDGLKLAVARGFLWTAELDYGVESFIVTDQTRRLYLARKLSGGNWKGILPGGHASWPIGSLEAESFPAIALCEGGPDFLAAFGHAWASSVEDRIAPVCIASAAVGIAKEALPCFGGKRARIFTHADEAGNKASDRWTAQLISVADKVDCWQFGSDWIQTAGQPVTDLNDLLRIDYDCWEDNRLELEAIMAF